MTKTDKKTLAEFKHELNDLLIERQTAGMAIASIEEDLPRPPLPLADGFFAKALGFLQEAKSEQEKEERMIAIRASLDELDGRIESKKTEIAALEAEEAGAERAKARAKLMELKDKFNQQGLEMLATFKQMKNTASEAGSYIDCVYAEWSEFPRAINDGRGVKIRGIGPSEAHKL